MVGFVATAAAVLYFEFKYAKVFAAAQHKKK
jgi:hypothetical protein